MCFGRDRGRETSANGSVTSTSAAMKRRSQHGDLVKAATECHRTATNTLVTWLIPLLMVWTSYIAAQHFDIASLTADNARATGFVSRAQGEDSNRKQYLAEAVSSLRAGGQTMQCNV